MLDDTRAPGSPTAPPASPPLVVGFDPIVHLGTRTGIGWTVSAVGSTSANDSATSAALVARALGAIQALRQHRSSDRRFVVVRIARDERVLSAVSDVVSDIVSRIGSNADGLVLELDGSSGWGTWSRSLEALRRVGVRFAADLDCDGWRWIGRLAGDTAHVRLRVDDPEVGGLVRSCCRSLASAGIDVVADGVTSWATALQLRRIGVRAAQGALFGPRGSAPAAPTFAPSSDLNETWPVPHHEEERLALVLASGVLDTPAEPSFDFIARTVASACGAPMALVSIMDAERQWFKARHGLRVRETRRAHAFCAHTVCQPTPLVVVDARADARFADNPLVMFPPHLRSYAGVPLLSSTGLAFGTVCVLDRRVRRFENAQLQELEAAARLIADSLELRAGRADPEMRAG
jgi:EAL domain-containing protein (putative c-di-GMP-specific phosphodiesterase class I)